MTTRFEQVKTEYGHGHQGGVDYGSKVRILMRSPDKILFVGYGVNLKKRTLKGWPEKIAKDIRKETLGEEKVRGIIISHFGPEADEWLLKAVATRGKGTILVDGGGERVPLPAQEKIRIKQDRYNSITATNTVKLEGLKTCLQCEATLPIVIEHVHFEYRQPGKDHPRTIEDCQRLTNAQVVSITGYPSNTPEEWWPYVCFFSTWDGMSYEDEHFCSDQCAAAFGRKVAQEQHPKKRIEETRHDQK